MADAVGQQPVEGAIRIGQALDDARQEEHVRAARGERTPPSCRAKGLVLEMLAAAAYVRRLLDDRPLRLVAPRKNLRNWKYELPSDPPKSATESRPPLTSAARRSPVRTGKEYSGVSQQHRVALEDRLAALYLQQRRAGALDDHRRAVSPVQWARASAHVA